MHLGLGAAASADWRGAPRPRDLAATLPLQLRCATALATLAGRPASPVCNLACTYCYCRLCRPETVGHVVRAVRDLGVRRLAFFGGEPLLNLAAMCHIVASAEKLGLDLPPTTRRGVRGGREGQTRRPGKASGGKQSCGSRWGRAGHGRGRARRDSEGDYRTEPKGERPR